MGGGVGGKGVMTTIVSERVFGAKSGGTDKALHSGSREERGVGRMKMRWGVTERNSTSDLPQEPVRKRPTPKLTYSVAILPVSASWKRIAMRSGLTWSLFARRRPCSLSLSVP